MYGSRSSEKTQIEYLVLLVKLEFALVFDSGLQHAADGDLRFVEDVSAEVVQQAEEIECACFFRRQTGEAEKNRIH